MSNLNFIRRWPDRCDAAVTRKGRMEPCNKTAVAVRIVPEEGHPYPVCAFHARGEMVPLRELLEPTQAEMRDRREDTP